MTRITKHTEANQESGTVIQCPDCTHTVRVYHLDWSAIICSQCKGEIPRDRWKLVPCSCFSEKAHAHEVNTIRINRGLRKLRWTTVDDLDREYKTGEISRKGKLCPLAIIDGVQE